MYRAYLAVGLALPALYFAFPAGGTGQTVIYTLLGASAAIALLSVRRGPWLLLGLGIACFTVGDVLLFFFVTHLMDAFYLAGYPLLTGGLLWLLFLSAHRNRPAALADAGIVLFAFAIFQWLFVLSESVHNGFVVAAYPTMDIVLLGGFAGFFVSPAWRTPAFWFLFGAVALQLFADEVYYGSSYGSGIWIAALWMASYVLWGTAALHPSRDAQRRSRRMPGLGGSVGGVGRL